jgi:mRNA-degrading endonuclease RelE of RelBE toxin-antitoxin system
MSSIEWTKKSLKQLKRIDRKDQVTIANAVDALAEWETARNVKALNNHQYGYRLRVGNYRVMFDVENQELVIVLIQEVKKRDEQTY